MPEQLLTSSHYSEVAKIFGQSRTERQVYSNQIADIAHQASRVWAQFLGSEQDAPTQAMLAMHGWAVGEARLLAKFAALKLSDYQDLSSFFKAYDGLITRFEDSVMNESEKDPNSKAQAAWLNQYLVKALWALHHPQIDDSTRKGFDIFSDTILELTRRKVPLGDYVNSNLAGAKAQIAVMKVANEVFNYEVILPDTSDPENINDVLMMDVNALTDVAFVTQAKDYLFLVDVKGFRGQVNRFTERGEVSADYLRTHDRKTVAYEQALIRDISKNFNLPLNVKVRHIVFKIPTGSTFLFRDGRPFPELHEQIAETLADLEFWTPLRNE